MSLPLTHLPPTPDARLVHRWATNVLQAFGLHDWNFGFNRRVRSLGICRYRKKKIELSIHLVTRNSAEEVLDTLLHEIAHALVGPGHGHGPVWKAKALHIGARPERCGNANMPEGNWCAGCSCCGIIYRRHRRPKKMTGWFCRPCGQDRGKLAWRLGEERVA